MIRWIYECVSFVSFSIIVNGEPRGHIVPTKGLRQGDHLSPYLFLLVSEGLNELIKHIVSDGKIQGFSLCRGGPKISRMFFTDDSLLFCRAKVEDIKTIQGILEVYEKFSGQQINIDKTTLSFGKSVCDTTKDFKKELLGVLEIKE